MPASALATLVAAVGLPVVFNIAGTVVPISAFEGLIDVGIDVVQLARVRDPTPHEVLVRIGPDLLKVGMAVSNVFIPGSGVAEALVFYALSKSRPMNAAEERLLWVRMQYRTGTVYDEEQYEAALQEVGNER